MRSIEIRRHCLTKKGAARGHGSHLSREGVLHARRLGTDMGWFDLVLTSHIPRTLETALAMGFAVDEQLEVLGEISAEGWAEIGHHERWSWEHPFATFAQIIASDGPTAQPGRLQREAWMRALESVSEGGNVLVISHGRVMESGLVTCVSGDFASWGAPFQHGEGVRMQYEGERFFGHQFLREAPLQSV